MFLIYDLCRYISTLFGVSTSTTWRAVNRCVCALYTYRYYFTRWPSQQEAHKTEAFFFASNGFPGCIGIFDGSHVRIKAPNEHCEAYFNRKNFPSIQFQVRNLCFYNFKKLLSNLIHCK